MSFVAREELWVRTQRRGGSPNWTIGLVVIRSLTKDSLCNWKVQHDTTRYTQSCQHYEGQGAGRDTKISGRVRFVERNERSMKYAIGDRLWNELWRSCGDIRHHARWIRSAGRILSAVASAVQLCHSVALWWVYFDGRPDLTIRPLRIRLFLETYRLLSLKHGCLDFGNLKPFHLGSFPYRIVDIQRYPWIPWKCRPRERGQSSSWSY